MYTFRFHPAGYPCGVVQSYGTGNSPLSQHVWLHQERLQINAGRCSLYILWYSLLQFNYSFTANYLSYTL